LQNWHYAEILLMPLDILSFADLNYFNGDMFNFVPVMWNF